ncbi:spatacsin [Harmonia axyridis]|uniref:spatacsin n=1 Tax=Harmonia axyridis TaxID=115357 RepID=UPI001E277092|nr:spatacsin [Harmonia axyridis]
MENKLKRTQSFTKETNAIWAAWLRMGNREVSREAVAKGTHVDLAIKFLSTRNEITQVDAETWFKNEVVIWVQELLRRKQIHKSKHILNNAGFDPLKELHNIFFLTNSVELRKYIGDHLIEQKYMEEITKNLWTFLEIILVNRNSVAGSSICESVADLYKKSPEWQSKIASTLFLLVYDNHLVPFIKPLDLFKYLIATSDELMKCWIALSFGNLECVEINCNSNLMDFFMKNTITEEMLLVLNCQHLGLSKNLKEDIFNELCKYGVFMKDEKLDLIKLLKRFLKFDISTIYDVLQSEKSSVDIKDFIKMLNDYCVENRIFSILGECSKYLPLENYKSLISSHVDLLIKYKQFKWDSEDSLRTNIMATIDFIRKCDYKEYFERNPLVLCSLIIFNNDIKFLDAFHEKINVEGVEISKYYNTILSKFGIIRKLVDKNEENEVYSNKSYYALLEKHLKINTRKLFEYRYTNVELPHFNCDRLVQKYGYKKDLDYVFYLRELRPSIASKLVILEQVQIKDNSNKDEITNKQVKKVFKIALNSFEVKELACSCICFLEMINVPSDKLKIYLNVVEILHESGYDSEQCKEMFQYHLEQNYFENIEELLETTVLFGIDFNFQSGQDFITAKEKYDIVIKFGRVNNSKLPEGFLKNCAMANDWLSFMLFAQIYCYPADQIKEVCQCFKNPFYLEHILHCVTYDIQVEEENALMKGRDSRKAFLSRIGVRLSSDPSGPYDIYSLKTQSVTRSDSLDVLEIDILNTKATLLQTLIRCHNSVDPPKALLQACHMYRHPILAILATCYEPDSVHTNWLTWLVVSCDLHRTYMNVEHIVTLAGTTMEVLNKAMENRFPATLLQSFQIFFPNNGLKHFLKFLHLGIQHIFDLDLMSNELTAFKKSLKICRKSSILPEFDREITYLRNRFWIEETALTLMASALEYNFRSTYDQIAFLKVIKALEVQEMFCIEVPSFYSILNILTALYEDGSNIRLDLSRALSLVHHREAVIKCQNDLLHQKNFSTALKVAQIGNLPCDLVILMEWEDKLDNRVEDKSFWSDCNESFKFHGVTADRVVEFYSNSTDKITDELVKFEVSKLAYQWAREFQLSFQYDLEKAMVLNYIKLEEKHKNPDLLDVHAETHLYKDILSKMEQLPAKDSFADKDSEYKVSDLVSLALEKGNFFFALRLERMFPCKCVDLDVLKLCFSLAEGLLTPSQLSMKDKTLLNKNSNFKSYSSSRRTLFSSRLSGLNTIVPYQYSSSPVINTDSNLEGGREEILSILRTLSEKLVSGSQIGSKIIQTYQVSLMLQVPYYTVLSNPDAGFLKKSLEKDCSTKLELVHDFVSIHKWSKVQVSDLICEQLVNHLQNYVETKADKPMMWDLNLNTHFHYILRLFQRDCSILGRKIFNYAQVLFRSHMTSTHEIRMNELTFIVELIIKANDCFTSDCNMQGISNVLNQCKTMVMHLVTLRSWKLIVRLLTGIARYTEMNYIFQILKDNDQFEYLLMKGSNRENSLKIALLAYLKKNCPMEKDLYKMVALHFAMFSEVALLWENDAIGVIKNLIGISKLEMQNNKINPDTEPYVLFTNTEGTRLCLSKAMENYTYATEFYLQGEKLMKAMHTAKQAELIAMQLSLFKGLSSSDTAVCVLDLEESQIVNLISSQLGFEQSLIVAEAYEYSPDWAAVLLKQCVLQNNTNYLEQFLNHLPLTETLIREISRRFISIYATITPEGVQNMKEILNKLPSVHAKYQIASELSFHDVVEDLLNTGQLCYLKDTVWKRGYRNS